LYQRLSRQQIIIGTLGDLERLKQYLKHQSMVEQIEPLVGTNRVRVNFSGTEEDAAELLRSLIHEGITITNFQCTQEDLETIFLKLGHQQAS
jgi:ABC-2 type transport system ATP-binding protein